MSNRDQLLEEVQTALHSLSSARDTLLSLEDHTLGAVRLPTILSTCRVHHLLLNVDFVHVYNEK